VHDRQALVLVHKGGAKGSELLQLAQDVQADVERRFGVSLEREVNVLPVEAG
jgi:UDP-N-acetylmuramate dehydrogenase